MPVPKLLPHDLKFLSRLHDGLKNAERGVLEAQASLTRASIASQMAQSAMNTFMEHVGEVYMLKPMDSIDGDGNISLVDPGWAQERAVAEANAQVPETPLQIEPAPVVEAPAQVVDAPAPEAVWPEALGVVVVEAAEEPPVLVPQSLAQKFH